MTNRLEAFIQLDLHKTGYTLEYTSGDKIIQHKSDGSGITEEVTDYTEIDKKVIELQAEYDAQEYARDRATEYPAIADQLDEIYHNGINAWKAVIKVTKDKYPKG